MRMIRPGLQRITRLLASSSLPWPAIHVAGTNGKGSICYYLSALLSRSNLRTGRFTSPHIVDRWDGIAIDGSPISEAIFREVEDRVKARNEAEAIDASEFEMLTATAFEVFTQQKCDIAVIECGMGGSQDATNVLRPHQKLVTVISRVGLDHQAWLGDSLTKIAHQKAGIMYQGVPCVMDATSHEEVQTEIRRLAAESNAPLFAVPKNSITPDPVVQGFTSTNFDVDVKEVQESWPWQPAVQRQNIRLAIRAFTLAAWKLSLPLKDCSDSLQDSYDRPPGRYQTVNLKGLTTHSCFATLDGAHNPQAFEELVAEVDEHRGKGIGMTSRVVWVLAATKGKDTNMFNLIPRSDAVILTGFAPVDGMPWVEAMEPEEIMPARWAEQQKERKRFKAWVEQQKIVDSEQDSLDKVEQRKDSRKLTEVQEPWDLERGKLQELGTYVCPDNSEALREAALLASGSEKANVIVAGSLYLVSDVLRLLRATLEGKKDEIWDRTTGPPAHP